MTEVKNNKFKLSDYKKNNKKRVTAVRPVSIFSDQIEYIEKNGLNASKLVRDLLDAAGIHDKKQYDKKS